MSTKFLKLASAGPCLYALTPAVWEITAAGTTYLKEIGKWPT